jgi:hypothetical protein
VKYNEETHRDAVANWIKTEMDKAFDKVIEKWFIGRHPQICIKCTRMGSKMKHCDHCAGTGISAIPLCELQ